MGADEGLGIGGKEITYAVIVFLSLFLAWVVRNSFVARRFKIRFSKVFLEEFKHAYPDSASLLAPDVGSQAAAILVNNRRLAMEINALEMAVAKRPEISNKSYAHFDSGYSRETQELIIDLLKNKIELASKFFNGLPAKVRSQINKKAEASYKTVGEEKSNDEAFKRDREKEEEKAKLFGLDTWRFGVLMTMYDVACRANLAVT